MRNQSKAFKILQMRIPALFIVFFLSMRTIAQPVAAKSIAGTVKDIHNEIITGATVRLMKMADSSFAKNEVTNETGKFYFNNLSTGNYQLIITGIGFKEYHSMPLSIDDLHPGIKLPLIVLLPGKSIELKGVTVTSN